MAEIKIIEEVFELLEPLGRMANQTKGITDTGAMGAPPNVTLPNALKLYEQEVELGKLYGQMQALLATDLKDTVAALKTMKKTDIEISKKMAGQ